MIRDILNKVSIKENKRRYLNLKGIASKHYAYKGPDVIQVDLTDKCNDHCLLCWLHTPFNDGDKDKNKNELNFSVIRNFISDVAKSDTKEIIFSGGGEPFLYSKIWEILEFTQKKGLTFRINTNFTLLNKEDIVRLSAFNKISSLTVSIWAGDATLYSKLHNRDVDIFYKVKNNLTIINNLKSASFNVRICAVINNLNYLGLKSLIDLAIETRCNTIEFVVPDVIPGVTDSFLLNKEQLNFVKQEFIDIVKGLNRKDHRLKIANKNMFFKRILNHRACFGEYDTSIDRIPCYAGWFFLRLRANGDFNSCLKSHRIPIGNIYKDNFLSIWNNFLQQEFRMKSLKVPKDKGYFKFMGNGNDRDVGCKRICDNIMLNERFQRIIKYLPWI